MEKIVQNDPRNALTSAIVKTMSSVDLLVIINTSRKESGESEVRRNDFMSRCRDELDGEHYETFVVKNPNGTTTECLALTRDQCMLVSMRESKKVRRSVLAKLKSLEAEGPTLSNPIMNMIVQQAIQYDKLEQEQQRLAAQLQLNTSLISTTTARMDSLENKVGAMEPQFYTIKAYANIVGTRVDDREAARLGKMAVRLSKDAGIDIGKAKDSVFGFVNRYHESILEQVFDTQPA
jgi:outer membrane murein-binding lipoprotein Lpp